VEKIEPIMGTGKIVENPDVPWPGPLTSLRPGRFRGMEIDREGEELVLQRLPETPGQARAQKANNCLQNPVRRHGISLMNPKGTVNECQHDGAVVMRLQRGDTVQAESFQPLAEELIGRMGKRRGQRAHREFANSVAEVGPDSIPPHRCRAYHFTRTR
jgi:hypothetical protein